MNERIRALVKHSGGEFWQRIESDGVLNKEAYITFDPPESLEKFVELIVRECIDIAKDVNRNPYLPDEEQARQIIKNITKHFGVDG